MINDNLRNISPISRLIFMTGSVIMALQSDHIQVILLFYLFFIIPFTLLLGRIYTHLKLLVIGMVPIFLSFILIYILVLNGTAGSWDFIFIKCFKLLIITSVIQLTLSIPPDQIIETFKKWGFKGNRLLILMGAFTVWAEVKSKSDQIITARFARGFIRKRNVFNTAKQLPYIVLPLIIGLIFTSTNRVYVWEQRDIPNLIEELQQTPIKYSRVINSLFSVIPWVMITVNYLLFS